MTNFIFKSREDLQKISQSILSKLEIIQKEQRHNRVDIQKVILLLNKLDNANQLQKQVDDFYDKDDEQNIGSSQIHED